MWKCTIIISGLNFWGEAGFLLLSVFGLLYSSLVLFPQCGFNRGCGSKFHVGYWVQQTPEEGWRTYQPKHCGNNDKDEDNSPKTLDDKNIISGFTIVLQHCWTLKTLLLLSSVKKKMHTNLSQWITDPLTQGLSILTQLFSHSKSLLFTKNHSQTDPQLFVWLILLMT